MKKLGLILIILCMISIAHAQDETHNISAPEAKDLLRSLNSKIADTARIDKLLRLALYNILKSGENKADLDNATTFISKAEIIAKPLNSTVINGYISWVRANLYRESGLREEGKKFAGKAIALLTNTSDKYHLGLAYLEMAHYYEYTDPKEILEKIHMTEQSVKALEQSNHTELKAYAYKSLADLYAAQAEYPKALQNIKLSLAAYQSIHYKQLQGVYIIYSSVYSLISDFKNALKYGFLALKTAEDVNDTTMQLCEINNIVAVMLGKMGEKEKAIGYYKNALQIAEKYNDHSSILLVVGNIVITYRSLNKYETALQFLKSIDPKYLETDNPAFAATISNMYCILCLKLNLYQQAKHHADKLLKIVSQHADGIADLLNVYNTLIKYGIATKQYELARTYLLKSDAYIKTNNYGSAMSISSNYALWFKLDSATGNYRSALNNYLQYIKIRDSLFTETKNKQLKQIEIQYETEKKEAQIKILNQKSELQQSKLHEAQNTRNWIIAGSCMVLIIAGLLYRQNTIRKKNNLIVTQKNDLLQHLLTEKEWLLKEVHHRVKNNLHTVICLLESQANYLENDALQAIESSQHRIYAMSLIHQKLYQSDDIKTIDMATYIPELVQSLEDSFAASKQINFKLNINSINLNISHAIPLGLIINEAVTNSIKYAFPDNRKGEISISMINDGSQIKLEIADNGVGIPEIVYDIEPESLGLRLIRGLSEDIDAEITFETNNGTRIVITFSQDLVNAPENFLPSSKTTEAYI